MVEIFSEPELTDDELYARTLFNKRTRQLGPSTYGTEGYTYPRIVHPTFKELLTASVRNTWIGSVINAPSWKFKGDIDPSFPGWHSYIKDTPYEMYAGSGDHVHSEEDAKRLVNWIDRRQEERANLHRAPGMAFLLGAGFMAGDPMTWLGLSMIGRMNKVRAARHMRSGTQAFMGVTKGRKTSSYVRAGMIFGGTQAPGEIARQWMDPTVTAKETGMILGAASIFGMLGGRSVSSLSSEARAMEIALQFQERGFAALNAPDWAKAAAFRASYDPYWVPGKDLIREIPTGAPKTRAQIAAEKLEDPGAIAVSVRPGMPEPPAGGAGGGAGTAGKTLGAAGEGRPVEQPGAHHPIGHWLQNIRLTPQQRTLGSPFGLVGQVSKQLFEVPWDTQALTQMIAHPESIVANLRLYLLPVAEAMREQEISFLAHRLQTAKSMVGRMGKIASISLRDRVKGSPPDKLSLAEFRQRVGRTIATGEKDAIEEINRMAKVWKDKVYTPLGEAAVKSGLLPAHASKVNYFNRIWNHDAIKTDLKRFEKMWEDYFTKNPTAKLTPKLTAPQAAKQVTNQILLDRPFTPLSEFEIGLAGPLHEMVLNIPHAFKGTSGAAVLDFMVTDVEAAARVFTRALGPDIELAKMFGITSVDDAGKLVMTQAGAMDGVRMQTMTGRIIADAFDDLKVTVKLSEKNAEKLDALLKHFNDSKKVITANARKIVNDGEAIRARAMYDDQIDKLLTDIISDGHAINQKVGRGISRVFDDVADIHAMRDLLRGTFGQPNNPARTLSRVLRTSRTFTAMTMLSGPLWSAIPDLAMPILHEGLKRTMGTTLSLLGNTSRKNIYKMSRREIELSGEALDMELATRALAITDFADISGKFSLFERGVDSANSFAFMANLFNPWNSFFKGWAGTIIQSRILETVVKQTAGGRLSLRDRNSLLRGTIDEDTAKIIAEQFNKYGKKEGKVWVARTEAWELKRPEVVTAVNRFRSALSADIRRTIITPNKSDLPLWVSTEYGAILASLKTFSFASIQRTLIPALQYKDKQAFIGVSMLTGLGMVVDELKSIQRGDLRPKTLSQRIQNGIERGGALGIFMDINRVIETASNNKIGIGPTLGTSPNYGTSFQNKAGSIAGPVVTQGLRIGDVFADLLTGNVDASTMYSARRLFPLNQVPYWDGAIFQPIEDMAGPYPSR